MQTDYTQSARKALKLAERAAKACHHSYVGSEHLLLGLVQEPDGTAGVILRNHKVEGKKLSELIAKLVAPDQIVLSPEEAGRRGHRGFCETQKSWHIFLNTGR